MLEKEDGKTFASILETSNNMLRMKGMPEMFYTFTTQDATGKVINSVIRFLVVKFKLGYMMNALNGLKWQLLNSAKSQGWNRGLADYVIVAPKEITHLGRSIIIFIELFSCFII